MASLYQKIDHDSESPVGSAILVSKFKGLDDRFNRQHQKRYKSFRCNTSSHDAQSPHILTTDTSRTNVCRRENHAQGGGNATSLARRFRTGLPGLKLLLAGDLDSISEAGAKALEHLWKLQEACANPSAEFVELTAHCGRCEALSIRSCLNERSLVLDLYDEATR